MQRSKSTTTVLSTKYSIKDDADTGIVLYWADGKKCSAQVKVWENNGTTPVWETSGRFISSPIQTQISAVRNFPRGIEVPLQEVKIAARFNEGGTDYNVSVFRSSGQPRPAVLPQSAFDLLIARTMGGDVSRTHLMPRKPKFIFAVACLLQRFVEPKEMTSFAWNDIDISLREPLNKFIDAVYEAKEAESLVSTAARILGWKVDKEAFAA